MVNEQQQGQISVSVRNRKKVVVEIPIDLLKHIAENHPDGPFKISNKLALGKYVAERLVEVTNPEDALCVAIDECVLLSYEDGEGFIQSLSEDEN